MPKMPRDPANSITAEVKEHNKTHRPFEIGVHIVLQGEGIAECISRCLRMSSNKRLPSIIVSSGGRMKLKPRQFSY